MQINAFISSDASGVLEDALDVFFSLELCHAPKITLSSGPTSRDRFQVKDTSRAVALNISKNNIIHCLWPESRDLYKEQADRQK